MSCSSFHNTTTIAKPDLDYSETANVVRAKVSSSSVTRSSSVVNGGHSRNNSLTKPALRTGGLQIDDFRGSPQSATRASAPPSTVGRSSTLGLSPSSHLFPPDATPSPTSSV
ncbi:14300_t:CDS:2, partial [Acaulospora colombiana]